MQKNSTLRSFIKWMLIASAVGIVIGLVGALFDISIRQATAFRTERPWMIYLLPLAGVVIPTIYKWMDMDSDKGTNSVIIAARSGKRLPMRTMLLIFAGTVLTHLCGGSAGREGAALQLGASMAHRIGAAVRLDKKDLRIMTMTGMSAGFSALFGTPLAAAVFAMEVTSVGSMQYTAIVPCIVSALVAWMVTDRLGVVPERFTITDIPFLTLSAFAKTLVIAAFGALISILFCVVLHKVSKAYKKRIPNAILRGGAGGILAAAVITLSGSRDFCGAGMDVIERAFLNPADPQAFIIKIILTAITLGAGFKGGEIVPVFFVGATFGSFVSPFLGVSPSFGAAIGMTALFCGVTNCPMASLFIAVELFGAEALPFFGVAAVSYLLSGYERLYSEQRISAPKTAHAHVDKKIK